MKITVHPTGTSLVHLGEIGRGAGIYSTDIHRYRNDTYALMNSQIEQTDWVW